MRQVVLADNTGFIQVSFWENAISQMEEGKSYNMYNVKSKIIKNKLILSVPANDAIVSSDAIFDTDLSKCQILEEEMAQSPTISTNNLLSYKFDFLKICIHCHKQVDIGPIINWLWNKIIFKKKEP